MTTRNFIAKEPEVKAILTTGQLSFRRPIKLPSGVETTGLIEDHNGRPAFGYYTRGDIGQLIYVSCRHGVVGDQLRVKEAWGYLGCVTGGSPERHAATALYLVDNTRREVSFPTFKALMAATPNQHIKFPAEYDDDLDEYEQLSVHNQLLNDWWQRMRKQPASRMPRWASRFTLEVTGVTVERGDAGWVWVVSAKVVV